MAKIIKCSKKDLDDFKNHYDKLYSLKIHNEGIKNGQELPANINDLIKHSDKVSKLLSKIRDLAIESK